MDDKTIDAILNHADGKVIGRYVHKTFDSLCPVIQKWADWLMGLKGEETLSASEHRVEVMPVPITAAPPDPIAPIRVDLEQEPRGQGPRGAQKPMKEPQRVVNPLSPVLVETADYRPALTRRERQVLDLFAQGHSTQMIALALSISQRTVQYFRGQLLAKHRLNSTAQLIRYAILDHHRTHDAPTPAVTVANHKVSSPAKAAVPVVPLTVPVSSSRRVMEPMEWPG